MAKEGSFLKHKPRRTKVTTYQETVPRSFYSYEGSKETPKKGGGRVGGEMQVINRNIHFISRGKGMEEGSSPF